MTENQSLSPPRGRTVHKQKQSRENSHREVVQSSIAGGRFEGFFLVALGPIHRMRIAWPEPNCFAVKVRAHLRRRND